MTDMQKLKGALNKIAEVFHEGYEVTEQDGTTSHRNRLAFIQDKVLNGICYQLAASLDWTSNKTFPDAQRAVARAIREHDGTEISEQRLEKALDWVSRIEDQMVLVKASLEVASERYSSCTGKAFSYGRKPVINEDVKLTPAMERAKAMGITTNVAADFNSNRAA